MITDDNSKKLFSSNEEKFRTLAQNIPDFIVRYDVNLCRTYVNPSWEKASGIFAKDVVDVPVSEIIRTQKHAVDFDYVSTIKKVFETGILQKVEFKWQNPHGEMLDLHYTLVPEFDHNGKVISVLAVGHDITERKQAEQQLIMLKHALNNSRDAAYLIDDRHHFIYVNDTACRTLGYDRQELLSMKISDIDADLSAEAIDQLGQEIRALGQTSIETRHKRRDGSIFPVEISGSVFEHDGQSIGISLARDITERKQAEYHLKILNHALNNSLDAAFLINEQLRFIYVNDTACRSLGYSRQELLSMKVTDIDPDLPAEVIKQLMQETLALGIHGVESRHRRRDGSIFPVEISASIVESEGQKIILTLVRNITERKQAENERQQKEVLLQKQMHQIRSFSSKIVKAREEERRSIAHELHDEFGQVLTGIKFSLEDLKRSGEYSTEEKIYNLQQDIGQLISRVRDLSMSLRPPLLDDLGLLPALQWHIERYTKQTGVQVNFNHEGIEQLIHLHDEKLVVFRIVQESLTNIARHAGVKKATVSLTANKSIIFVNVNDEGIGFDLNKEIGLSKSIGLIGMRERVENIGGICTIKTSPTKGTQLSFQIPIHK